MDISCHLSQSLRTNTMYPCLFPLTHMHTHKHTWTLTCFPLSLKPEVTSGISAVSLWGNLPPLPAAFSNAAPVLDCPYFMALLLLIHFHIILDTSCSASCCDQTGQINTQHKQRTCAFFFFPPPPLLCKYFEYFTTMSMAWWSCV